MAVLCVCRVTVTVAVAVAVWLCGCVWLCVARYRDAATCSVACAT